VESVRTGLRNIMKDLLRTRPQDEAVTLAWPLVCGKEVAARTAAVGFADGVLTVEASDREWQAQLSGFSGRYVAAFNDLLGPIVQQVKFVLKKPATGNTRTGSERQQ
jgi:Dna[CI] antecedent DciA-like protein